MLITIHNRLKVLRLLKKAHVFLIVGFFLFAPEACALSLDSKAKSLANDAMKNIFSQWVRLPPEALTKDFNGLYEISFRSDDTQLHIHYARIEEEKEMESNPAYAYWSFPALGMRLSIYYQDLMTDKKERADVYKMISDRIQPLYDYQQTQLPLQLEVTSAHAAYKPGEEFQYNVVLKNKGTQALRVAALNEESLFCLIDNKKWGTEDLKPKARDKVLQPGKSLKKSFKLTMPSRADEVSITCVYGLSFKGVKPYAHLNIKVQAP